jgi:hypothetical protein
MLRQPESISLKKRKFEISFNKDGSIEFYDCNSPSEGFVFENEKEIYRVINFLTDIMDREG